MRRGWRPAFAWSPCGRTPANRWILDNAALGRRSRFDGSRNYFEPGSDTCFTTCAVASCLPEGKKGPE